MNRIKLQEIIHNFCTIAPIMNQLLVKTEKCAEIAALVMYEELSQVVVHTGKHVTEIHICSSMQ